MFGLGEIEGRDRKKEIEGRIRDKEIERFRNKETKRQS
jgi:hypothetical protein